MMLSTPRNPPYRVPSMSPPCAYRSPKRKRSETDGAGSPAMRIDTKITTKAEAEADSESPRTRVANKLKSLEIDGVGDGRVVVNALPRKKLRRTAARATVECGSEFGLADANASCILQSELDFTAGTAEIMETPDCKPKQPSRSAPAPLQHNLSVQLAASPCTHPPKASRLSSPPPPAPVPSPTHVTDTALQRPMSPLALSDDASLSPAALFWQHSEITGLSIDATLDDDDGEGLNGIGFNPTPAMAYARSQKRKQQVSEWRAREAREARQKRFERRRGGGGSRGEPGKARLVRFAGFG